VLRRLFNRQNQFPRALFAGKLPFNHHDIRARLPVSVNPVSRPRLK